MFTRIRHFLAPPVFEDEDKTRVAGLLNVISLAVLPLSVMYGIASLFIYPDPVPVLAFIGIVVLLGLGALSLMRSGRVRFACVSLSFALWGIVTLGVFDFGGVRGPSFSGYFVVILIAGLLLGGRAGIAFAGLSIVAGLGMLYAETSGILPPSPIPITPASTWTLMTAILVLAAVLLYLATRGLNDALERARRNERAVAESNRKLQLEITELAQAEEALRQGEAKYRNLLENIPQKVFYKDKDSIYVTVNPSYARDFGLEPEDFVGKTDFDFFPKGLAEKYRADDERIMDAGVTEELDEGYVHQGEQRTVHTLKTPVRDGLGNIVGILGIFWDITERKRAEEALTGERRLLRTLIDNLPDFIYVKDTESRFVIGNIAVARVMGATKPDELLGKTDFDFYPQELAAQYYADEQEVIRSSQALVSREETLLDQVTGKRGWLSTTKVPLRDSQGKIVGIVGTGRDITERKRAERQLQHYAAELERNNEELKAFAYTVSHDLRAPLVNLKGFAAELRAALAVIGSAVITALPTLDEEQRLAVTTALQEDLPEALGFIDSSVTRMDHFINALLELSRLGRCKLKFEPVDMGGLVQVALQTLDHQIEERQVSVTVGPLSEVVADRASMEQILGNLLGNAVKYLDPGRPGEIEVTAERGRDETTFRVRDNGRGIAEEDMDKVFAPFRRIGRQDVPGEGMGLPYVQTLVRRHGGRIWCESEPGVGTTFIFTLSNHFAKGDDDV
jgi:PAS domain S-box-containing protein